MTVSEAPESSAMTVVRVPTEHGSRPEPPLDDSWDDLTKLRWLAGIVSHDSGLPVTVHVSEPGTWLRPSTYQYVSPGRGLSWGSGGYGYHELWRALHSFEDGVRAQKYFAAKTDP